MTSPLTAIIALIASLGWLCPFDDPPTASAPHAEPPKAEKTGTLIVLNKSDGTASLIDPSSGDTVALLEVGEGPHEVAVSPDGRTAVAAVYGGREPGRTLAVIDVENAKVTKTIDLQQYHRPHGIMYLPDGHRVVVTAESERKLLIVDVEAGEVDAAIDTDQDISHMVALTPDAETAYVANIRSGSVSVIDLSERALVRVIETGAGAEGVAVAPDGKSVWVSNRAADTISIIDTGTNEIIATRECASFPIRVMFTPAGDHALISNARSGDVSVFDALERKEIARVKIEDETVDEDEQRRRLFGRTFGSSPVPIGIVVQPDGRFAYVANSNTDTVVVIETNTWEVVRRFNTGREPDGLGWSTVRATPQRSTEPETPGSQ